MTDSLATLVGRTDTFLGVCQAVGDDFGFNPNWLRVSLALPLLFNPVMSLAAYGALALAVIVSRLLVPATPRGCKAALAAAMPYDRSAPANDADELALAA